MSIKWSIFWPSPPWSMINPNKTITTIAIIGHRPLHAQFIASNTAGIKCMLPHTSKCRSWWWLSSHHDQMGEEFRNSNTNYCRYQYCFCFQHQQSFWFRSTWLYRLPLMHQITNNTHELARWFAREEVATETKFTLTRQKDVGKKVNGVVIWWCCWSNLQSTLPNSTIKICPLLTRFFVLHLKIYLT